MLYSVRVNIWCCTLSSHRHLTCYIWHVISDTDTGHVILDTWYRTPALDMLYYTWLLIHDTWSCTGTWYVILATWSWHLIYDMIHASIYLPRFHMVQVHWPDTIIPDTCIIWHIHDYHFYGDLAWLLYCYQTFGTPKLLCSWTPVFLNPWKRETPDTILLLIPVIE